MKVSTIAVTLVASIASCFSDAFVAPSAFKHRTSGTKLNFNFMDKMLDKAFSFEVIEGVHLPKDFPFKDKARAMFDLNYSSNIAILKDKFGEEVTNTANKLLLNKKRHEVVDQWPYIQQKAINDVIKKNVDDPDPAAGYFYFGNGNYEDSLSLLVKENPFFAMSLTAGKDSKGEDCFELVSYDGDMMKANPEHRYFKYTSKLVQDYLSINVRFNADMKVVAMTTLENGKEVVIPADEYNKYASGIIYSLSYVASAMHATIHVLHFIMCTGIVHACDHDKSLSTWAQPYDDNITIKCLEVAMLLMVHEFGPAFKKLEQHPDKYFVTGKDGFGAETGTINPYNKELLVAWGKCKTADDFINTFLLKDLYSSGGKALAEKAGLLSEFSKHAAMVTPFAEELSGAMKASDEKAFAMAEEELTEFMSKCGEGVSEINSISSWVQLMSMTGIVHGSTISYTRGVMMPEVMAWRDRSLDIWNEDDLGLISMFATVDGMEIDRHVMSSAMPNMLIKKWDTAKIDHNVLSVLEKYDAKTKEMKEQYKAHITTDKEWFREFGWIASDWCPDGFDGKQLTITTYI